VITDAIQKLVDRIDLDEAEARSAMEDLMSGQATDAQVAGFLTALRMKGETAGELVSFARVMRERAEPFWEGERPAYPSHPGHLRYRRRSPGNVQHLDGVCFRGCGGIGPSRETRESIRFQHVWQRRCTGSSWGRHPDASRSASQCSCGRGNRASSCAQRFHRSMKHVMPARTQLKFRTVFNLIGPLANPALPQVSGTRSFFRRI
jgi:hypothetical protein